MKRFLLLLAALALLAPLALIQPAACGAAYQLEATREEAGLLPLGILGVVEGRGVSGQLAEVARVFHADLRRTRIFAVRDLGLDVAEPPDRVLGETRIRDIALQEAVEAMTWVRLSAEGGDYVLEGHVYDAARGRLVLGKRYRGDKDALRTMVHRFVSDMVRYYTGEPGIATTRIAYISNATGTKEVYLMDYDGAGATRVTGDGGIALNPALNAAGNELLYVSQKGGAWRVFQVDIATGKRYVALAEGALSMSPAWHPKGDGFVVSIRSAGNSDIYSVSATGRIRRLTTHPASDVSPSYSPDGKHIAFTSDRDGKPQIYVMNADGSGARRASFGGEYNTEPDWSPAGESIAFTCRIGKWFHICKVPASGGSQTQLTTGAWDDESPSFSPDGRHLAFSSTRLGRANIYIMDADGQHPERLTYGAAQNIHPSWSGYGKQ